MKIATFLEDDRAARAGVPVSPLLFIENWPKRHVMKTDGQYSAFLNPRGVR